MIDAPTGSTPPERRLPGALTALDDALRLVTAGLAPVAPRACPLAEALGRRGAAGPSVDAVPPGHVALCDGWAFRAAELSGASAYAPLPLARPPHWVHAGDPLPENADCVVEPEAVDASGPLALAMFDSFPGENIRRAGQDLPADWPAELEGRRLDAFDLLAAERAGMTHLPVRAPRVMLVEIPSRDGKRVTAALVARLLRDAGADASLRLSRDRSAAAIAQALDEARADLILTIGGTGRGRDDHVAEALDSAGRLHAHGLALRPGRSAALGHVGGVPVIALPGLPDQALAVWWALAEPALDVLSAARRAPRMALPLERKIASSIGLAEIVLLQRRGATYLPLATGDLPLHRLREATHVYLVAAGSEGCAPATPIEARRLRMDVSA